MRLFHQKKKSSIKPKISFLPKSEPAAGTSFMNFLMLGCVAVTQKLNLIRNKIMHMIEININRNYIRRKNNICVN